MKINITNCIIFTNRTYSYKFGKNNVQEIYDDNNILQQRIIWDEFSRDIDSKTFDIQGNVVEHLHKDYFKNDTEEGVIETFKNRNQEYVRRAYTKTENGLKHSIDDFKSAKGKSYLNDFVHDLSGKLIKIISNGKEFKL